MIEQKLQEKVEDTIVAASVNEAKVPRDK
jgi:hypothetical protein